MFSFAIKGASSLKKKKPHCMENHSLCAANTNNDELQRGKAPMRCIHLCTHAEINESNTNGVCMQ